ncbi:Neurotransmitter-gated ion-channel ligand-binding domain-containing protein [Caenorhabditis elegans]|uniref:Neurotransmitter-gated ion-channel ligand-binding domain-containing protein n=1 Tax=Caenorhabditis elegans TaxID=6239 RepID=Q8TA50_CAEEL|nr:Neurotransmitter-gated ion-channel ligand-binding domain-containing protein [Caenorhabditis elegans]CCD70545.1 Neurotransmitter-gated ion-channel ligand-binding domain-containing protein [Caenorhabditis elegans]|eukprot:NP_740978.1 Ligand-Gated ion Channel [Caenorhabditis elegans]
MVEARWISLLLSLVTLSVAAYDIDCKWKSNITDIEDVAHHKYQVLEECLFYKLTSDADRMQDKSNALMMLPPTVAAGETLEVQVLDGSITEMWMNEVFKEMNINGFLKLSWKDRRLRWNPEEWKTEVLRLKSMGRLWSPDINSDKLQTGSQSTDFVNYHDIQSNYNGNVTARLEFRMKAQCQIDYTEYPNDRKHCCFNLQSNLYKRYVRFIMEHEGAHEMLNTKNTKTNWHIDPMYTWISKMNQENDNRAERLEVCVGVVRKSSTLAVELTLPVLISALILLLAPFFGKFNQQIYVKMFALLLQFLSFQFLAEKTPQLGFGDNIPKIYVFYAFTIGMTVLSLIATVMISAMSRVKRKVPPAHRYTLLASLLNANLCCGSEEEPTTDGTSSKDATSDWLQVHSALNNLSSILLIFIYIIGAIVIAF